MMSPTRRAERIEWIALGAALVPFVVAVTRAAVQHWMPVGDAAYFTVRSRDVFSAHTPLLGAWSSGSSVVGVSVNNLGPLQLDLLAPFTTISPYLGTGIGSAAINAASVAIIWFVARRLVTPVAVALVMSATTLFVATLGLAWLVDARQQYAMVIPFFALLWVTAGMWAGVTSTVPIGLALASLLVQTHFTYVYQTVVVTAAGAVGFVVATRAVTDRRQRKRIGLVSVAVLVVCWIQPLLDQFFGTGNLGRVFGPARDRQAGAGIDAGIQVVAGASLIPPFWLPGSIGSFLQPDDGVTIRVAALVVVVWTVASAGVVRLGRRTRRRNVAALGIAGVVALLGAVVAATAIPVSSFGLVPQNYYWLWSVGAFLTIGLLAAVSAVPGLLTWRGSAPVGLARTGMIVVVVSAVALAAWPRYPVASVARDEREADRIGRPLRAKLRAELIAGLRSQSIDDTVEVDLSRAFFGNNYPFVMLVELQRAGIDFRFTPENRNLDRFGRSRCTPVGEYQRLLIIAGRDPILAPGSIVLAQVVGITDDELHELAVLDEHFGALLRSGAVSVDLDAIRTKLGEPVEQLIAVTDAPGASASGLARSLDHWRSWGYVDLPASEREAFERWFDLERRSSADYQTIVLEPPAGEQDANPGGSGRQSC